MMQKYKMIYVVLIFLMYSSSSRPEDTVHNTKILEDYLNTIENMSFIFEQYSPNQEKVLGWMQIEKPNKLRIEYKGNNDLIIISNDYYLILYKAHDDIITSLSNDGPWNILTKDDLKFSSNKNNSVANGIIESTRELQINGANHIFYKILMRDKNKKLLPPIILHTSTKPFTIKGWTIFDNKNQGTQIKIIEELSFNNEKIKENMFTLSEKNRQEGTLWKGPFKKKQVARRKKHRN
mgnify:FL=1